MDKVIFNARGSEICDKFWKGMGLCCHIFFLIWAWYILANLDDILGADYMDEDFGNFSIIIEQQKLQFQVFMSSWLTYNIVYLLLMGLLVYGIALVWFFFEELKIPLKIVAIIEIDFRHVMNSCYHG
ncbi:hypothetical protein ACFFRR_004225 [Megaselia abdita]